MNTNPTKALGLVTPAEYVAERPQVFPGVESLRWFALPLKTREPTCCGAWRPVNA